MSKSKRQDTDGNTKDNYDILEEISVRDLVSLVNRRKGWEPIGGISIKPEDQRLGGQVMYLQSIVRTK